MTDNEIIKALECCTDVSRCCTECPYNEMDAPDCAERMMKETFSFIKYQQEYIEDLQVLTGMQRKRKYYWKFVTEVYQKEKGELHYPDFDEIYRRYFEQHEIIEALIAGQETLQKHFAEKMCKIVEELEERADDCKRYWENFGDEDEVSIMLGYKRAIGVVKGAINDR